MKRKWLFIFLAIFVLLITGIVYLNNSTSNSLSGQSTSIILNEQKFADLNIKLTIPNDLILKDVSSIFNKYEGVYGNLIIEGGNGMSGFPWVKIYQFNKEDFSEEYFKTQYFINQDEIRVREQYEVNSLIFPDNGSNIEKITFTYYTNITIFQKRDQLILCKDWIGEEINNKILLVSICASDMQWEKLDQVYEEIIKSIEYIE